MSAGIAMRALQWIAAAGILFTWVSGCGRSGVSASSGSGGLADAGGSSATGGVQGTGGAGGITAAGGTGGIRAAGGTTGVGGALSAADAGVLPDASGPADGPPLLCRPAPPCPSGWNYVYDDSICGYGSTTCSHNGDGLCYRECKTDSDCVDPGFGKCGSISVFGGSDYAPGKGVCVSTSPVKKC